METSVASLGNESGTPKRPSAARRALGIALALTAALGLGAAGPVTAGTKSSVDPQIGLLPPSWSQTLAATQRFEAVLGNAAVLDHETGLVWERSPDNSTVRVWSDAEAVCLNSVAGNRKGWRMPTLQELESLVDPTQTRPALPAGHPFGNVQSYGYWSVTSSLNGGPDTVWIVDFTDGGALTGDRLLGNFVWCVRGGQGAPDAQ